MKESEQWMVCGVCGPYLMLRTSTSGGMGMKTRAKRRLKNSIWYMKRPLEYTRYSSRKRTS